MKFKAACIDCDGTIVDSEQHHWRAWLTILNPMGIDIPFQHFAQNWVGKPEKALAADLLADHKLKFSAEELITKKTAAFQKLCAESQVPLLPGIEESLKRLKEQGVKLAVVSGGQRQNVLDAIHNNNLTHYFETIVTANDVENNKPAPDSYLAACAHMQVNPSDAFAIEDSASGIKAAKAAGLTCYGIHHAFIALESLGQADHIYDNHPAILAHLLS